MRHTPRIGRIVDEGLNKDEMDFCVDFFNEIYPYEPLVTKENCSSIPTDLIIKHGLVAIDNNNISDFGKKIIYKLINKNLKG